MRALDSIDWLVDVVWIACVVVILRLVVPRLLGVEIGGLICVLGGVLGVGAGLLAQHLMSNGASHTTPFVSFAIVSLFATMVAIATLALLVRPRTDGYVGPGLQRGVPHPVKALRRRVVRTRRYLQIMKIAARHGLPRYFGRGVRRRERQTNRAVGVALRDAFTEAGGLFVKLGQVLSARPDVVPRELAQELTSLQDDVTPVALEAIIGVVTGELGRAPADVFASFEELPLAAASIAQVHRARLLSGDEVIVKVQRPGVAELIAGDLDIILRLTATIEKRTPWGQRMGAGALARGFADNLTSELDFSVEVANTEAMAQVIGSSGSLHVPKVYSALSTRRMFVAEWIDGVRLREARPLFDGLAIDRFNLARTLLESFLSQILETGVFHADPHPGNVLVRPDGSLALLDFGSIGRLDSAQQSALRQAILGIALRNPTILADALVDLSPTIEKVDVDAFDRGVAQFVARQLGPGMAPGAEILNQLLRLMVDYGLALEPELAGVFRALATLDGTLRLLDPDFNSIEEAKHYALRHGFGVPRPDDLRDALSEDLLLALPALRRIPRRIDRLAGLAERGQLTVRLRADPSDVAVVTRLANRLMLALLSASLGLVSALLLVAGGGPTIVNGTSLFELLAYVGLAAATTLGLRIIVAISRDVE